MVWQVAAASMAPVPPSECPLHLLVLVSARLPAGAATHGGTDGAGVGGWPGVGGRRGARRRDVAHAPNLRASRRARPGGLGGGGGSTPLSDRASRSPTTIPFTSSDEPP